MPAGRVRLCEECAFRERFARQLKFLAAGFETESGAERCRQFGSWLLARVGGRSACRKLPGHLPLLRTWLSLAGAALDPAAVVARFDTRCLQPRTLFAQFLRDQGLELEGHRRRRIEHDRVVSMVAQLPTQGPARPWAEGYLTMLQGRSGTTDTAIRLAMRPAVDLLRHAHAHGGTPTQADVDQVLRDTPGQRDALYGFIVHLNRQLRSPLSIPGRNERRPFQRLKLERKLKEAAQQARASPSAEHRLAFVRLSLQYFHRLAPKQSRGVRPGEIVCQQGECVVVVEGKRYTVPDIEAGG